MSNSNRRVTPPYERGGADAWYGREPDPHYYVGDTYSGEKVKITDENSIEYLQYFEGYYDMPFGQKEWG